MIQQPGFYSRLLFFMLFRLSDIDKSFGGTEILRGVSFQVNAGEKIGLVGRNGAGKTTLINNISGLDHPTGGRITFDADIVAQSGQWIETYARMGDRLGEAQ